MAAHFPLITKSSGKIFPEPCNVFPQNINLYLHSLVPHQTDFLPVLSLPVFPELPAAAPAAVPADILYTAEVRFALIPDTQFPDEEHSAGMPDIRRSAEARPVPSPDTRYSAGVPGSPYSAVEPGTLGLRSAAGADSRTAEQPADNYYTAEASAGILPGADTVHPQVQELR